MEPVALCYGYWGGWWLHTPIGQSLPHLPRLLVPHAIGVSCLQGKGLGNTGQGRCAPGQGGWEWT